MSYTIFIFSLFFFFDFLLDSMMPQDLFCLPYSVTNNFHHSVPCLSLSSITPLSHLLSSISLTTCSVSCILTPCPFVLLLSLSFQHLSITPCLPIPTLSTYYSVPCDSVSHFLHSPYYPVCHITPSPVVSKSFQLVVIS